MIRGIIPTPDLTSVHDENRVQPNRFSDDNLEVWRKIRASRLLHFATRVS